MPSMNITKVPSMELVTDVVKQLKVRDEELKTNIDYVDITLRNNIGQTRDELQRNIHQSNRHITALEDERINDLGVSYRLPVSNHDLHGDIKTFIERWSYDEENRTLVEINDDCLISHGRSLYIKPYPHYGYKFVSNIEPDEDGFYKIVIGNSPFYYRFDRNVSFIKIFIHAIKGVFSK